MRKIKDEPALPRGESSGVKTKIIELDRKIGHKIFMSIREFFVDRDDLAHLVDHVIHYMEVIRKASAEGDNGVDQFFAEYLSFYGAAALRVSVFMCFLHE